METSPPRELAHRLRRAAARELLELVGDHGRGFTLREVRQVLLNPFVTPEVISELAAIRSLLTIYEVRSAIARHRRTPETLALRFVAGLFWRDLLEISVDLRISPAVRRVAEKYLVQRVGRLAVGERIALARRAGREILTHLRTDPSVHVFKALLENPRLTEEVLLPVAASSATLPRILDALGANPRWGRQYELRVALSRNPSTPLRVVFEILPGLRREDLLAAAAIDGHSSWVRRRCRELAQERTARRPGSAAGEDSSC